jgi:hypothetical protein
MQLTISTTYERNCTFTKSFHLKGVSEFSERDTTSIAHLAVRLSIPSATTSLTHSMRSPSVRMQTIDPDRCTATIMTAKIDVKLMKTSGERWDGLEAAE